MIKIAVCDDDLEVLHTVSALLDRYSAERDCEISYLTYNSPLELIAGIERGLCFDMIFLDILMPGENGMELAQEIRSYDQAVKLIFVTSSPEFAVQSYAVQATFYLLKPINGENLFPVLDRTISLCEVAQKEKLILKCRTGITAVSPDKLEYCEVNGHNLILHVKDGTVLESTGKLEMLEENLRPLGCFLRVHRSYLVNMAYIHSISYRTVTMQCQAEIPIPHGKYNDLKKSYLAYAFENERVLL